MPLLNRKLDVLRRPFRSSTVMSRCSSSTSTKNSWRNIQRGDSPKKIFGMTVRYSVRRQSNREIRQGLSKSIIAGVRPEPGWNRPLDPGTRGFSSQPCSKICISSRAYPVSDVLGWPKYGVTRSSICNINSLRRRPLTEPHTENHAEWATNLESIKIQIFGSLNSREG